MILSKDLLENMGDAKIIGIVGSSEPKIAAMLLHQLFQSLQQSSILITNKYLCAEDVILTLSEDKSQNDSILKNLLNKIAGKELQYCFVQISPELVQQNEFKDLNFNILAFFGLEKNDKNPLNDLKTQRDFTKIFFDQLPKNAFALSNLDDKNGEFILQNTKAKKRSYAQKTMADFKVKILEKNYFGSLLNIDNKEVWVTTKQEKECCELLCAYAVASLLDVDKATILLFLSGMMANRGSIEKELTKKFNQKTI